MARVALTREERAAVAAQQAWLRHFWAQAAKARRFALRGLAPAFPAPAHSPLRPTTDPGIVQLPPSHPPQMGVLPHLSRERAELWAIVCPDWGSALSPDGADTPSPRTSPLCAPRPRGHGSAPSQPPEAPPRPPEQAPPGAGTTTACPSTDWSRPWRTPSTCASPRRAAALRPSLAATLPRLAATPPLPPPSRNRAALSW